MATTNKNTALAVTDDNQGFTALANTDFTAMVSEETEGLDLSFDKIKIPSAGSTNYVGYWTFSSTAYLTRQTTNGKAGLGLGSSSLILGSQGTWVDLNTLRAICAQLAGKTVYLPANSTGLGS